MVSDGDRGCLFSLLPVRGLRPENLRSASALCQPQRRVSPDGSQLWDTDSPGCKLPSCWAPSAGGAAHAPSPMKANVSECYGHSGGRGAGFTGQEADTVERGLRHKSTKSKTLHHKGPYSGNNPSSLL